MGETSRVFPMRFSPEPERMVRFLEVLGLRRVLESERGGYAAFEGAAGSVAVHSVEGADSDVANGVTSLNVLVADVDATAAVLREAGLDADAWDEAYGRQGAVRTPRGAAGLNEATPADLYGYRAVEGGDAPLTDVIAVWYSDDFARDAAFFAHLGFTPEGSLDDPWWCALWGADGAGGIGLHTPDPASVETPVDASGWLEHPALVRLGFETREPLDALVARLRDAGYDSARLTADEAGPKVVLTDPDGQYLEIHPRA
ncbi:MAG: VOC family protein [Propionibacteriaceae bacterium]|nr:VOC family protein [Propionibacteriaceae bacterium]